MNARRTVAPETLRLPPRAPETQLGSVSSEISAHLEKLIAVGDLAPGDRLPSERDLAAALGVSRASLREAMHELEAKHLLERRPGRGTTVLPAPERVQALYSQLSDAEHQLRDVAELRETIEPRLAELAALRATPAHLAELENLLREPLSGPRESLRLDLEFHLLLATASGNPLMSAVNTVVCSWTSATRLASHSTRYAREVSLLGHRAILEAVRAGDGPAARAAMTRHLADVAALTRDDIHRSENHDHP
ncbi:FadR/GntR family transcriptional regulator [Kineosporia succinea]|uniref:GntR family transcriptional repressor for pyruvate dehydrogenase complex n=1 Tax=Kineosporia succinea TaxID=84632 RepID=A0ABT9PCW1_9ACTN|nr:FadR/GntR family transcriptional regulator [Kineosporia succinea]MDP9829805.1 GntR family transcriptional repressor for pyruvate dehydrogenase complex [Kineosporia succinea]